MLPSRKASAGARHVDLRAVDDLEIAVRRAIDPHRERAGGELRRRRGRPEPVQPVASLPDDVDARRGESPTREGVAALHRHRTRERGGGQHDVGAPDVGGEERRGGRSGDSGGPVRGVTPRAGGEAFGGDPVGTGRLSGGEQKGREGDAKEGESHGRTNVGADGRTISPFLSQCAQSLRATRNACAPLSPPPGACACPRRGCGRDRSRGICGGS